MENNIFINTDIYPNAQKLFECKSKALDEIKDTCLVVLDTNVLLIPYATSKESFNKIEGVYTALIEKKRLYIPAQVAREFVNNRPTELKNTYQKISQQRRNIPNVISSKGYVIFEPLQVYKEILDAEKDLNKAIQDYQKKIDHLLNQVKGWVWNDPVSKLYEKLFVDGVVKDIKLEDADRKIIKADLEKRYKHKIPPGYKDSAKPDLGIGDLLIWKTILELGKDNKQDVIFITGEEKNDWWYKSDKQALYPRYELIHEFKDYTEGYSFHILKLSELLALSNVDEAVLAEVQNEEKEKEIITSEKPSDTQPLEG